MLPVPLQFLLAMLAHAINERMARRVEYLQEEVRVLKELLVAETGTTRMAFTTEQRRRLAIKGKALTPEERRASCQIVRPETILKWFASSRPRGTTAPTSPGSPAGLAR